MKQQKISLVDKVLDYLEARQYEIITHTELYEAVWEVPAYGGYKNTLYATISQARSLLEDGCTIYGLRGTGYMFVKEKKE